MSRRRILAVAVVVLVLLAGCAGSGGGGDSGMDAPRSGDAAGGADGGDGGGAEPDQPEQAGGDGSTGASPDIQNRAIIRTGTVRVEVENATATRDSLESRVADLGGYTSGSELRARSRDNRTWYEGYVVVRVPSENFSRMLEAARESGTVRSENTETEDVTDQLVDLNARLENLRAERDRLRTLYNRSNSTEDVLAVQERLSDVQGEIERLEARKRSLENRVAFSTLRIELVEPRPDFARLDRTPFHEQSPLSALNDSIATMVVVARTLFIAGVIALPWVAVVLIPVGAVAVALRYYLGRN
ncbi:MAG: DUF4349 domain-containing protein [Haloarculaceae archaeon]